MKTETLIGVAVIGAGAVYLFSRSQGGAGLFGGSSSIWAPQSRAVPYDPIVQAGGVPSTQSGGAQNIIGGAVQAFSRILSSAVQKITAPGNAPASPANPTSIGAPGGPSQPYGTAQIAPFPQASPVPNVAGPTMALNYGTLLNWNSMPILNGSPIMSTVPLYQAPQIATPGGNLSGQQQYGIQAYF